MDMIVECSESLVSVIVIDQKISLPNLFFKGIQKSPRQVTNTAVLFPLPVNTLAAELRQTFLLVPKNTTALRRVPHYTVSIAFALQQTRGKNGGGFN